MQEINGSDTNANPDSSIDDKLRWRSTTGQIVGFQVGANGTVGTVNGEPATLPTAIAANTDANNLYRAARTHSLITSQDPDGDWDVRFAGPEFFQKLQAGALPQSLAAAPAADLAMQTALVSTCAADATGAGACSAQAGAGTATGAGACAAQAGAGSATGAGACAAQAGAGTATGAGACAAQAGLGTATGAGACGSQAGAGTATGAGACGAQAGAGAACGAQACGADSCAAAACPANACGANACVGDLGLLPCAAEACFLNTGVIPECPFIL